MFMFLFCKFLTLLSEVSKWFEFENRVNENDGNIGEGRGGRNKCEKKTNQCEPIRGLGDSAPSHACIIY